MSMTEEYEMDEPKTKWQIDITLHTALSMWYESRCTLTALEDGDDVTARTIESAEADLHQRSMELAQAYKKAKPV